MPTTKYEAKLPQTNSPSLAAPRRPRRDVPMYSSNFVSSSCRNVAMAWPSFPRVNRARIASSFFALLLISLTAPRSWAAIDGSDAFVPDAQTAVPTLVQHVATGMDRYPINTLTIQLPNPVRAGNCLILGVQFNSAGSVASVTDERGNNWIAGPTATNASLSKRMNLYYVLNAIAGSQTIKVRFSGLSHTNAYPQAVVSEFYNVATANALDGSAASSISRTAALLQRPHREI